MKKPASPMDIFLWQIRGVLFGLLSAIALFLVPAWATSSLEMFLIACLSILALPVLGFVVGTLWGSRTKRDDGR